MIRATLLVCLLLCKCIAYGQNTKTISDPFPEPEEQSIHELITLKNGITLLFNISDEGITNRVYDKNKKLIASEKIPNKAWTERKFSAIETIKFTEINQQPVLFIQQRYRGNIPVLHRLIFDPSTGKLLKAEEALRSATLDNISVAIDPVSDNYALIIKAYPRITKSNENRIQGLLYDGDHKLISRATLDGEANNADVLRCLEWYMYNKELFIVVSQETRRKKSNNLPAYLLSLKNGQEQFKQSRLDIRPISADTDVWLRFDPATNKLMMMSIVLTDEENKQRMLGNVSTTTYLYQSFFTSIDPATHSVDFTKPINGLKLKEFARKELKNPKGFSGVPSTFLITENGEYVVIAKETETVTSGRTTNYYVKNIGVLFLDKNGDEKDGYVLKNAQTTRYSPYFGHYYFFHKGGAYFFHNDLPENFNKAVNKTQKSLATISDAEMIMEYLNNGRIEKSRVFDKSDRWSAKFFMPDCSYFNKETGEYTTVMISRKGRKKQAYLAWLQY